MPLPRLADVKCFPIRFQPGDRVLVRVLQSMDQSSLQKLKRTVEKWAGDHVEVLVIDTTRLDLEICQSALGNSQRSQ